MNYSLLFRKLVSYSLIRFLVTGGFGVLLNLVVVFGITEFVVGRENYMIGYFSGFIVNLLFNFLIHTLWTFETKRWHKRRLVIFIMYHIGMTLLQALVINLLVGLIGIEWYLIIIALVIGFFSIITYVVFKFFLFKDTI